MHSITASASSQPATPNERRRRREKASCLLARKRDVRKTNEHVQGLLETESPDLGPRAAGSTDRSIDRSSDLAHYTYNGSKKMNLDRLLGSPTQSVGRSNQTLSAIPQPLNQADRPKPLTQFSQGRPRNRKPNLPTCRARNIGNRASTTAR